MTSPVKPLGIGILLLGLLPLARPFAPWGTSGLLLLASGLILHGIASRRRDRALIGLVWGALALRSIIALGMYLVSAWGLPVASSLQLGGGFWSFAPDAPNHHRVIVRMIEAWQTGGEHPYEYFGNGWFYLIVAALYRWMGVHPLHGIFLNAVMGVASALVASASARRLGGASAARVAAALVVCWPSVVIWSTQLLKDQLGFFFVVVTIHLAIWWCQAVGRLESSPEGWRRALGPLAGLGLATFLLMSVRLLCALALAASGILVFGLWAGIAWWHRQRKMGVALAMTVILLPLAAYGGSRIYPFDLLPKVARWRFPQPPTWIVSGSPLLGQGKTSLTRLPEAIARMRKNRAIGHSLVHPEADLSSSAKIFAYLPKGVMAAMFAPLPWQADEAQGLTGRLRSWAMVESAWIACLLPFAGFGGFKLIRSRSASSVSIGWWLSLYLVIGMVILALTEVNLGNLVRLRVPALLVLPLFAGLGGWEGIWPRGRFSCAA